MNPFAAVKRHPEAALIVAAQAALVVVVGRHASVSWPHSDAQTYFSQAVMLWQGLFPPDPARPIFYPFFLSLGMKIFGLSPWGLVVWQALPLLATTALTYRLALLAAGRRAAAAAAAVFAFFPGSLLYGSLFFYREGLTACLLAAVLNLVEYMRRDPDRRVIAFCAGVPAGGLTLLKPEFASLLALLALSDLATAGRDLRRRLAPWLVCGLTAVACTLPAVALDKVVFDEWFYINTYSGFNYYLSYCDPAPAPPDGRPFSVRDGERYQRAHPAAIDVMFLAAPSVPFTERDRRLSAAARQCIAADPAEAASKYFHRMLDALFLFEGSVGEMNSGGHGRWNPALLQALRLFSLTLQLTVVLLLLPALPLLWRSATGRLLVITLAWFVVFYASVTYLSRFRVAVWPVWAVVAGAGISGLQQWRRQPGWARAAAAVWLVAAVLLMGRETVGRARELAAPEKWTARTGSGPSATEKRNNLIELAGSFIETKNYAGLERDLGGFIRDRRQSLDGQTLRDAGDYFARLGYPDGAVFFEGLAEELYPGAVNP